MTTLSEATESSPQIVPHDAYSYKALYVVKAEHPEHSPRIEHLKSQIRTLEKEMKEEISKLIKTVIVPNGWTNECKNHSATSSDVDVTVSKIIWAESPVKPDKAATKLQEICRLIDAKTLFNSGILSREEKRALLGFDTSVAEEPKSKNA